MAELLVPTISGQEFSGEGLAAARNVTLGKHVNAYAPRFGIDPTGQKNSTAGVNKAIAEAHSDFIKGKGSGIVYFPPGIILITPGEVQVPGRTVLLGSPKNTFFLADTSKMPAGGYTEPTAMVGVGTWTTYGGNGGDAGDPYQMRCGVEKIVFKGVYAEDWQAPDSKIPKNLVGILFNTYLGGTGVQQNPDSYNHLADIEIWDVDFPVLIIGPDDQGMKVNNIHADRFGSAGMIVGRPPWHPQQVPSSGADNHFFNVDVHGGNVFGGNFAGVEVYTSNCVFVACKAWYMKRNLADNTTVDSANTKDRYWRLRHGAGFFIAGGRNKFLGCETQETGNHGWVFAADRISVTNCTADAASYFRMAGTVDATGTTSDQVNTAAGFAITTAVSDLTMSSCNSFNLRKAGNATKWGYWIQPGATKISLSACRAADLASEDLAVSNTSNFHPTIKDVFIHVNNRIYTNHVTTQI